MSFQSLKKILAKPLLPILMRIKGNYTYYPNKIMWYLTNFYLMHFIYTEYLSIIYVYGLKFM